MTKKKAKIFFGLVNNPSPQVDDVDVILLQEEQAAQYQTQKQQELKIQKTPFTCFFDENIKNKIVGGTNNRINETRSFVESRKL